VPQYVQFVYCSRSRLHKTFPSATGSSAACPPGYWWSKPRNTAARASRCALEQNRDVCAVPGNVINKNSWGPNTLIKQGAKLFTTWEDVWEELPADVQSALGFMQNESHEPETASLFPDEVASPHEKKILRLLKAD